MKFDFAQVLKRRVSEKIVHNACLSNNSILHNKQLSPCTLGFKMFERYFTVKILMIKILALFS